MSASARVQLHQLQYTPPVIIHCPSFTSSPHFRAVTVRMSQPIPMFSTSMTKGFHLPRAAHIAEPQALL